MAKLPGKVPPPNYTTIAPPKEFDGLIKEMKKAKEDTKELEAAHKEMVDASKKLAAAHKVTHASLTQHHALVLDACKTPTSSGPQPIPYPLLEKAKKDSQGRIKSLGKAEKDLEKSTKKMAKVLDKKSAELSSKLKRCSGDEAGTLKGVVTSVNKGKVYMQKWSSNVMAEGKSVMRFSDMTTSNHP